MTDQEFLLWIRDKLEFIHGENPNVDYMLKLKAIAKKCKTTTITMVGSDND